MFSFLYNPSPTRTWSRYTSPLFAESQSLAALIAKQSIRKSVLLQCRSNAAPLTKAQSQSRIAQGLWPTSHGQNTTFATQAAVGSHYVNNTNPNSAQLPRSGSYLALVHPDGTTTPIFPITQSNYIIEKETTLETDAINDTVAANAITTFYNTCEQQQQQQANLQPMPRTSASHSAAVSIIDVQPELSYNLHTFLRALLPSQLPFVQDGGTLILPETSSIGKDSIEIRTNTGLTTDRAWRAHSGSGVGDKINLNSNGLNTFSDNNTLSSATIVLPIPVVTNVFSSSDGNDDATLTIEWSLPSYLQPCNYTNTSTNITLSLYIVNADTGDNVYTMLNIAATTSSTSVLVSNLTTIIPTVFLVYMTSSTTTPENVLLTSNQSNSWAIKVTPLS